MNRMPSTSSGRNPGVSGSSSLRPGRGTKKATSAAVDPQRVGCAYRGDQNAADRSSEEQRALLDRSANPARALHPRASQLDEIGQQRGARRRARSIEECAHEHEREQRPELQADGRVQQRDGRDCRGARKICDDARCPKPEAVHDHAAEEGGDHDREEVEEHRERGQRRAPRGRQDEPRDRELRDGVARERDDVGGVERVERRPAAHGGHRKPSLQSAAL
jgi:hypothetical protein